MPFLPNQNLDEDDQQPQQAAPILSSSSSAPITGETPQSSSASSSGRFTNIQNYLDANKAQSGSLAKGITESIDSSLSSAKSAAQQRSDDTRSQAMANTVQADQSVLNQVNEDPLNVDVQAFSRMRDAEYRGPQDVDYSTESYAIDQGLDRIGLTETESGRNTLLGETYDRPNYSQGETRLDQVLLQNSDNARAEFDRTRDTWNGIGDWLSGVTSQDRAAIEQARTQTESARQAALNTLGGFDDPETTDVDEASGAFGSLQQSLRDRVNDYRDTDYFGRAVDDVKDLSVADAELFERLGLEDGQTLYGVDPSQFIQRAQVDPTETQVATEEDLARYQALARLAGQDPTYLSSAGSYSPYDVQASQLQQAIEQAEGRYNRYQALEEDPIQAARSEMVNLGNYLGGNHGAVLANAFNNVKTRDDLDQVRQDIASGNLRSGGLVYDDNYFTNFRGSDSDLGRARASRVKSAWDEILGYLGRIEDYGVDQQISMEGNN